MATTIELDPETAKALAEHAEAVGLTIRDYLKKHFIGAKGPLAAVHHADRWLDELSDGLGNLPPLPHDFSTKDVYADHD